MPLLGVVALTGTAPATAADAGSASHQAAVAQARAGQFDRALPALEELVQRYPARAAYRYDWIAVLSWADRHAQALAASRSLRLTAQVPDYVLSAIGRSALHGGEPARSAQAYRLLAQRRPADGDAALGWALALLEQREPAQADAQLRRVLRLGQRTPALLRAAHEALQGRGEAQRALPFAERLAALGQPVAVPPPSASAAAAPAAAVQEPARGSASSATAEPAAPPAPAERVAGAPAPDFETLLQSHAERIRAAAAELDRDFTTSRYRLADAVLAENAALATQAQAAGRADIVRRLRQDRVQALRDRGDMAAAIAEYRLLAQESPPAPYATRAAADALLATRQPEAARSLYEQLLAADPADAAARNGLLYAQLEAEDFAGISRTLEGWAAASGPDSPALRRARATMLRFADRLDEAEAALGALAQAAPQDAGLWLEQGDLLARRGLPRAAQRRYEAVLAAEPQSLRARVGLANTLWAQGDIVAAGAAVEALRREGPEHPAVQRLLREWERRSAPSLNSNLTRGFGQGQVAGNDDLVWESALYSGQTAQGLRAFATHHLASAKFNGAQARHERVAGGGEWTLRDMQLVAELGQDLRNARDTVWAAGVGVQHGDHWSWKLRHESQTNDFPLKGRQPGAQAGAPTYLHASRTVLGGAYRWNESRRVAADASWYDFNDGNRRQALALSWLERLYSAEGRTLDLTVAGYGSRNSLPDTVYFNPKRDLAVSATLSGDWLTWRRYERTFNQRVALTVGNYRQTSDVRRGNGFAEQSYGWKPFQDVRYEHEWQWGPDASARYGVGARRFAYDGVYETKSYLYLGLNWRF